MEMYEWMHRNPVCGAYPLHYVCDTAVIAQHDRFVAVNSAIQVDLTGQNNSEKGVPVRAQFERLGWAARLHEGRRC